MRLRNDPNSAKYLEQLDFVIKSFPIYLNNKTILEIGMGKGEMLIEMAKSNTDLIYIGIEKFPTVCAKAAKKIENLQLSNIFLICSDIEKIKENFEGQVNEIWLTFSDPWPKKRHFKRRLTYKSFLDIYKSLLSANGILKIKTDNDNFFNWSKESILKYGAKIIYETNDLHKSKKNESNIQTGYEIKWSSKGKNINYMEISFN